MGNHCLLVFSGDHIILGFLRWCRIASIHSTRLFSYGPSAVNSMFAGKTSEDLNSQVVEAVIQHAESGAKTEPTKASARTAEVLKMDMLSTFRVCFVFCAVGLSSAFGFLRGSTVSDTLIRATFRLEIGRFLCNPLFRRKLFRFASCSQAFLERPCYWCACVCGFVCVWFCVCVCARLFVCICV